MPLRRLLPLLLAALLLTGQALATWSIVVVNRRTGEVCIASATCLENFNLRKGIGVVAAEVGGGATQSLAVASATRKWIHDLMLEGVPPEEILDIIAVGDPLWPVRQIGLVDMAGRAVTYSGWQCGTWFGGVTGAQGDYVYAIQGNVLTGQPVVDQCELAFLNANGDLGQKVMAAMEAARAMGGDGRCSCDAWQPERCGAPPPNFSKSAHVAFILIARPGEQEICIPAGCAGGDFYLGLNYATQTASDPDPVLLMQQDYAAWRLALQGRPDAMHSTVWPDVLAVPAQGAAPVLYELDLADVDGVPLAQGGAAITLAHDPRSAGVATLGQVVDHGDGTYTVEVLPGDGAGTDLLRFGVDDGIHPVTLWPPARLLRDPGPTAPLLAGAPPALPGPALRTALHLSPDGLSLWTIGSSGAGTQLLVQTRAAAGAPFGAPSAVDLGGFDPARVNDLAVSADGLRILFSADPHAGGPQRIWRATRASTAVGFDAPFHDPDLNSGAGDACPALSADELEVVFASERDGGWDLWRARRLSSTGRFEPPEKLHALSLPFADEFAPQRDEGGARLWFTRRPAGESARLMEARLRPEGVYAPASPAAGLHDGRERVAVAVESGEGPVWSLEWGSVLLPPLTQPRAPGSLAVDVEALSAAAGGTATFALDCGAAFAGAPYRLLPGAPGFSTLYAAGVVLPFERSAAIEAWVRDPANAAFLPGFAGALDPQGRAAAQWILPAGSATGSALIGRSVVVLGWSQSGSTTFLSNAVTVAVEP